jgi:hypothetical protein
MTATLTVTAEQLGRALDAVQDATGLFDGIEVLSDYSGRAMYGATCLGVTGGADIAAMLLLALAEQAGTDHTELLAELVVRDGWRRDSLGLDELTYWPGIQVSDRLDHRDHTRLRKCPSVGSIRRVRTCGPSEYRSHP